MKDNRFYFQHDNTAFSDEKIIDLRGSLGMEGYGIYWALIELLHQNGGKMQMLSKRLAFALQVNEQKIISVISDFNLFTIDGTLFYSKRLTDQIEYRAAIVEKRREAGKCSANAQQMLNKKTYKGKERKGKDINTDITWKNDFDVYMQSCRNGYKEFMTNESLLADQERLNPGIDLRLTIEKGFKNYWGTEIGWKHKKKSRTTEIDWKATIVNSISNSMNRVYLRK